MRTIVAFGDSWTSGLNKLDDKRYYVTSFVEHISTQLGWDLINYGVDGNSNPAIMSQVLSHEFKPNEFALITWSGSTRDWDWDSSDMMFKKPSWVGGRQHKEHSQCYYMSEVSIRATENYLTSNSISYIMASAFDENSTIRDEEWEHWHKGTLKDFCEEDLEVCQHPNADGHKKIADGLINSVLYRSTEYV